MSDQTEIRITVFWLYTAAAATFVNSVLLQIFSHYIDLVVGLSFTQYIDAVFVGLRTVEPPGAPVTFWIVSALIVDAVIVLFVILLTAKISHGSSHAAGTLFFVYVIDTAIFAYELGNAKVSNLQLQPLQWGMAMLTVLAHIAGSVIIFRAWRILRRKLQPPVPVVT